MNKRLLSLLVCCWFSPQVFSQINLVHQLFEIQVYSYNGSNQARFTVFEKAEFFLDGTAIEHVNIKPSPFSKDFDFQCVVFASKSIISKYFDQSIYSEAAVFFSFLPLKTFTKSFYEMEKDFWYYSRYVHPLIFLGLLLTIFFIIRSNRRKCLIEKNNLEIIINTRTSELLAQKSKVESQAMQLDFKNKQLGQLSIVAEKTENPVIIATVDTEIEWVNDFFYKYFNQSADSLKLLKINDLFPQLDLVAIGESGKSITTSQKILTRFNREIWFQISVTPVRDSNDEIANYIIILSDISHLIELNSTRDLIISVITHDLKSPLFGFKMMAKTLSENLDYYSPEQLKERIDAMYSSSSSISELLENLTEWFRSQRGVLKFLPINFDIYLIISEIIAIYEPEANAKKISLINQVEINTFIFADENMLRTVIRNILSNAIRYSGSGVVIFSAEKRQHEIVISVSDEGIGIDNDVKTKILDKNTREGLGLLICKEFVEKNGGELWFGDTKQGTTVKLSLPKAFNQ